MLLECSKQPLTHASATCCADAKEKSDNKLMAIASKAPESMPESSGGTRVTTLRHSCVGWGQAEKDDDNFMIYEF